MMTSLFYDDLSLNNLEIVKSKLFIFRSVFESGLRMYVQYVQKSDISSENKEMA